MNMKKFIILVFCILSPIRILLAQNSILGCLQYTPSWSPTASIVGGCIDSSVVTLQTDFSGYRFSKERKSVQSCEIIVPSGLAINDICSFGKWVFFVGKDQNTNQGLIGYFYLHELDPQNTSNVVNFFYYNIAQASSLNRLLVYSSSDERIHIMAIGEDEYFLSSAMYVSQLVFEWPDFVNQFNVYQYRESPVFGINPIKYSDLCQTGRYVCIVGQLTLGGTNMLTLNRCDLISPLFGNMDTLYYYPEPDDVTGYPELLITGIKDTVVTVVYRTRDSSLGYNDCTRIRTFGLHSMENYYSQQILSPQKTYIEDLVYIPRDESIVLLEQVPFGNVYLSAFRYILPEPSGCNNVVMAYDPDNKYHSDTLVGDRYYAASGENCWLYRNKMSSFPAMNNYVMYPQQCPFYDSVQIMPIPDLTTNRINNMNLVTMIVEILPNPVPLPVIYRPLRKVCQSED